MTLRRHLNKNNQRANRLGQQPGRFAYKKGPLTHYQILLLIIAAIFIVILLRQKPPNLPRVWPLVKRQVDERFNEHNITHTFISAIPKLTKEMNLEVATSHQTEVFERTDTRRLLGINLGTNIAQIKVPVTYRYHIRLYDPWQLQITGQTLLVRSPRLQACLPPAIHTDQLEQHIVRGWARWTPTELLQQLHHDLTPILSQYATDTRRMELVRETCRIGVAEFVRRWLEAENRWSREGFTAILVQFGDEPTPPSQPVLHLDFNSNQT
jgi:hypothetical protein